MSSVRAILAARTNHVPNTLNPENTVLIRLDKRDLDLHVHVGNKEYIHFNVDLDPTVDCRDDIEKCLELNFSSAVLVVPPGRHRSRFRLGSVSSIQLQAF